jgi:REP element-mobilizing transposase RayT
MPAYPRHEIVATDEIGVYHCIARCVRKAFLCGVDSVTGHNYEHRKDWIRERLQELASIFAIDICGYAVMSNHLHLVLRARPDLVQGWRDEEIALRWERLFPPRDPATQDPVKPLECDLNMILSNPTRVAELRARLGSLSWFMRCLSEPIARRANREDQCTGRFWEGRFKSQKLLDEAAILACSVYVDLNPIRAGVAETPEQSQYTSVFDRLRSQPPAFSQPTPSRQPESLASAADGPSRESPAMQSQRADSWLCELTIHPGPNQHVVASNPTAIQEQGLQSAPDVEAASLPVCGSRAEHPARASDQGFLPIELHAYLSLLDWTGRQIRAESRGAIPAEFAPILERLGLKSDGWLDTVLRFGRWFKQVVGGRDSLKALAKRMRRGWFHGQRAASVAFL